MSIARSRSMFVAAVVVALVATSCGDDGEANPVTTTGGGSVTTEASTAPLPDEANPASIEITLDPGPAVSGSIGFDGGSLRATGADGTVFVLVVPPGALLSEVEIVMTPIVDASGDAIGDTFLAGVNLEPSGLHFLDLVTLEIASPAIDAGSLAFGAESGGDDLHLTPSTASNGSVVLGITHFSDFGAVAEQFGELVQDLVPLGHEARAAHELARGGSRHALDAATRYADLLEGNAPSTFSEWVGWTGDIMSLLIRVSENVARHGWTVDTSGFPDLIDSLQALIDAWFARSDAQVQDIGGRCSGGDVNAFFEVALVTRVSAWMSAEIGVDRADTTTAWFMTAASCLRLGVLWQADIVTTGTGANAGFYSDISVAAEIQPTSLFEQAIGLADFLTQHASPGEFELGLVPIDAPLAVDYIDGFWHDTCVPRSGSALMSLSTKMSIPNVGTGGGQFADMRVSIQIVEDVFIDCSQGFAFPADAQLPFHGGALREMNSDREDGDGWTFPLEIDPGGGVVAQLDEEVDTLSWSDGQYELHQLLTVYVGD